LIVLLERSIKTVLDRTFHQRIQQAGTRHSTCTHLAEWSAVHRGTSQVLFVWATTPHDV
jgi:hypothetical protein